MAPLSCIKVFLGLQAVGLVPEDKANGAKPMETDAAGPNKRRRITNRVYVGSSDLSYRREHMEVYLATDAGTQAVCNDKTLPKFANCVTCRWKGLCIKGYIKTWMWFRSFGNMPSSELHLTCHSPKASHVDFHVTQRAASKRACAMIGA